MSKQSERLFEAISHLNDEILDPALEPRRRKTKYHYITGNDGPLWPPVCVWWWAWCGCCLCWAGAAAVTVEPAARLRFSPTPGRCFP